MSECNHCGEPGAYYRRLFEAALCDPCFEGHCDGHAQRQSEGWDDY